ncbi:MAG: SemiSWEET transporter [bacterium]
MNLVMALGLIAASLTTVSNLPQAIKAVKTKQTKDLSLITYLIVALGGALWLAYGIIIGDTPLVAGNSIALVLTILILFLKLKHG